MKGRHLAMAGGAVWYLLRFALVTLIVLRIVPDDPLFHINLIWIGGQSLLLVAVFARGMVGDAVDHYLPILVVGVVLAIVGDVAAAVTSSYLTVPERNGAAEAGITQLFFLMTYGVLVVDLLILAALISYRSMRGNGEPPQEHAGDGPSHDVTQVERDS